MEHYLQDKAKTKAIAIYTFNTIAGPEQKELAANILLQGLKDTIKII